MEFFLQGKEGDFFSASCTLSTACWIVPNVQTVRVWYLDLS